MPAPEKIIQCKCGWKWKRCTALEDVCWKGSICQWYPQGRSKGLLLARKWLKMVKHDDASPFLAYARAQLLPRMSLVSLPSFLMYQQQSLLFGASFSALWPHSSFSFPQTAKAAVWSGVLLIFFRRQNSGQPYLPRSPKPGWRELGNQSISSSSLRAKILLAWIISFMMQA